MIFSIFNILQDKNPKSIGNSTPLDEAALNGHFHVVELILNNVSDKNPSVWMGCGITPLHRAAENGHVSVCELIMSHLKDKNPRDYDGNTPLHSAAQKGHFELCCLILENIKIDTDLSNLNNSYGKTPLDLARRRGHTEIVQLIISSIYKAAMGNLKKK